MKSKKIAAIVALLLLLTFLFLVISLPALRLRNPAVGDQISLSTNKTPIYQKAPYPVIDFFERQEDVVLFAEVSQGTAVSNALVTFQVNGPPNQYENISFSNAVVTNSSGVASLRFRVPWPIENHTEIVFGNWTSTAQTRIGDKVINDTRVFRVSWPVEILSVKTVDANCSSLTFFPKKGEVGVQIRLRNNDAKPVKVVVKGTAYDNSNTPVGRLELSGLEVPPGTINTIYSKLVLSDEVLILSGEATLRVGLYNEKGIAYCPDASSSFFLRIEPRLLHILPQDVTVMNVSSSLNKADVGETVDVSVVVRNDGNKTQSFTVFVYDNDFPITSLNVNSLLPSSERTLHFAWDTTNAPYGNQSLRAWATPVPWEVNLADNSSPAETLMLSLPKTPAEQGIPRTLFIILLLILLLFLIPLIALVVRRRKKEPFDSAEFTFFFFSLKHPAVACFVGT